ncbi:uncharacterized protein SPPG_02818 [Spizellomyces punctatus DAOM BR117]|uniref:Peptidase S8/S53 domain-containing protein n=1 Tax=Spizellomyces punctatus (strain DAOM BR117) TaxID=645134 RepID=A0A0L0HLN7_SPIPD|nr:uncharacterized protein SPPG_02818 [Spizellomyces punctatus DAOM BR117]KND02346.1 hypothetical protein SPPG_02818 [Spizellomyces punctatus DAOM BR117]|eukprot:XP_016610385.1 hypothetical protein SPPG_02818 [Spizellomyces punctatus DAOM BR117]
MLVVQSKLIGFLIFMVLRQLAIIAGPATSKNLIIKLRLNESISFSMALAKFRAQYEIGGFIKVRSLYPEVFGGLSVELLERNKVNFNETDAVERIWPVENYAGPYPLAPIPPDISGVYPHLSSPLMHLTHRMTGVEGVIGQFDGTGVKVAIVDSAASKELLWTNVAATGVDYTHPALGGCFGEGCRIAHGYDFAGDGFRGENGPDPVPDSDPMDCTGHGTHVAGIIAGLDDRVAGVAPNVTLAAYKVFGCEGGTNSELILKALEQAYADAVDIVNLSIGTSGGWPDTPEAVSATSLARLGVIVVAAQGNYGVQGLWSAPAPAVSPPTLAVASCENTYFLGGFFTLSTNASHNVTYASTSNITMLPTNVPLRVAPTDACTPLPSSASFNSSIVLVKRGGCTFNRKAVNIRDVGGIAMIVWNDREGLYRFALERPLTELVVFSIEQAEGEWIRGIIESQQGDVTLLLDGELKVLDNPNGGRIADYSSWGPAPSLELKPDITAPGSIVYSTYPVFKGSYYPLSGTSMASPYLAGCMAILRQKFGPNLTNIEAVNLLQTTAIPIVHPTLSNTVVSIPSQGTGLINLQAAINTTVRLTPSKIRLGQSSNVSLPFTVTLQFNNTGSEDVAYSVSHTSASSINVTDPMIVPPAESNNYPATTEFDTSTLIVPALGTTQLSVHIYPPNISATEQWLFSGVINAVPTNSIVPTALHATYLGLLGSYLDIPLLPPNGSYPYILRYPDNTTFATNTTSAPVPFNPADEVLALVFSLQLPARKVQVELLNGGDSVGLIGRLNWVGRNGGNRLVYKLLWRGELLNDDGGDGNVGEWEGGNTEEAGTMQGAGPAGAGTYLIRVRFERDSSAEMETITEDWISPDIVIP